MWFGDQVNRHRINISRFGRTLERSSRKGAFRWGGLADSVELFANAAARQSCLYSSWRASLMVAAWFGSLWRPASSGRRKARAARNRERVMLTLTATGENMAVH